MPTQPSEDTKRLTVLAIHPGALTPFALKLKPEDTLDSIKARAARKLAIPKSQIESNETGEAGLEARYQWASVWYGLEDDPHFLDSPVDPQCPGGLPSLSAQNAPSSIYSPSTYRLGDGFISSNLNAGFRPSSPNTQNGTQDDSGSLFSASMPGLNMNSKGKKKEPSMHLIASSGASVVGGDGSTIKSGRSGGKKVKKAKSISGMSGMSAVQKGQVHGVPAHKIAFEKFHNELGVRTFIGSIGPIENVRMMMKGGHRACYMSRSFALAHNFIPKDAAPGFYGFSGITNLGSWPIKIGERTVEQTVMLVENSYFPVVLGRSFMEKRGVKTDPLDQTSVIFMDTGETVPCDIVVVKDANGNPIPVS